MNRCTPLWISMSFFSSRQRTRAKILLILSTWTTHAALVLAVRWLRPWQPGRAGSSGWNWKLGLRRWLWHARLLESLTDEQLEDYVSRTITRSATRVSAKRKEQTGGLSHNHCLAFFRACLIPARKACAMILAYPASFSD